MAPLIMAFLFTIGLPLGVSYVKADSMAYNVKDGTWAPVYSERHVSIQQGLEEERKRLLSSMEYHSKWMADDTARLAKVEKLLQFLKENPKAAEALSSITFQGVEWEKRK